MKSKHVPINKITKCKPKHPALESEFIPIACPRVQKFKCLFVIKNVRSYHTLLKLSNDTLLKAEYQFFYQE